MILYLFNNNFPDNAGFGKRCKKEIEILSEKEEIMVLCKKNCSIEEAPYIKIGNNNVQIARFTTYFGGNQKIHDYEMKKGFYEFGRNLDLTFGMMTQLCKLLWQHKAKNIKLYVIVSPLTVPLIGYIIGKVFNASPQVVEFHDLEPELAMHIKNLNHDSLITRIEFHLEKIICNLYNRVVVTTNTQAERIIKRTQIDKNKVLVIPNSIQVEDSKNSVRGVVNVNSAFNVGYISSFSYSHSISGIIKLIKLLAINKNQYKNIMITVVGEGSLLSEVKDLTKKLNILDVFTFTGNRKNVAEFIKNFDATIIPWEQDEMTETMLPTKLFEYMAAKKTIIAPNFGEFNTALTHNSDALLYNTTEELLSYINRLQHDKNLCTKLEINAYKKYMESYYPDIFSQKLLDFIN
ncbi:hypothetical protein BH09PAT2_BH09PAT2_01430 [soil metagenome]